MHAAQGDVAAGLAAVMMSRRTAARPVTMTILTSLPFTSHLRISGKREPRGSARKTTVMFAAVPAAAMRSISGAWRRESANTSLSSRSNQKKHPRFPCLGKIPFQDPRLGAQARLAQAGMHICVMTDDTAVAGWAAPMMSSTTNAEAAVMATLTSPTSTSRHPSCGSREWRKTSAQRHTAICVVSPAAATRSGGGIWTRGNV
mmetsp:Transcript_41584/g.85514  ORF Transcript_41584/g.85514 Transcript_41584/m.85514 type:complete len:202 (-) Transcript_41584:460-1065(-)